MRHGRRRQSSVKQVEYFSLVSDPNKQKEGLKPSFIITFSSEIQRKLRGLIAVSLFTVLNASQMTSYFLDF